MNIPAWQYLVSMPLYIGILMILVELMRKYYKASAIYWILARLKISGMLLIYLLFLQGRFAGRTIQIFPSSGWWPPVYSCYLSMPRYY